ncbi:ATP-binding protein [Algibacter sp. 2305UL17-15]|uniref:ATP-binding response regulator n=1 Tax=Algibacter sp. 2305UL17-15 TaxID=3231268 RepID=UPI00345A6389
MLKAYKKRYYKNNLQYILVDDSGCVLETDTLVLPVEKHKQLQTVHPFFEILNNLLHIDNECFEFSCINLDLESQAIIVDVTIHSESKNKNLIIIEDLTTHYKNYQLTAQSRNESIINSQVLELKNKYLLEKEKFKNNFIANFSHQLRNPITASIIFSDLLIKENLSSEQKNYLDIVQSANKDLKNRIEDILDISKIESGKLTLDEKVFDLKALLNDITEGYKHLITKKNLEFHVVIDPKLPEFLHGDAYRLKQIIGNLLNNAIKFTPTGSIALKISLNYERANKANIQIVVSDTGIGIDAENHEQIFERFKTLSSQIKNKGGIGLGLSIVKHLVLKLNGNIAVESELNAGSKFTCNISFKLTRYNKSLKKELIDNLKKNHSSKYNILLVENAELIQLSILKLLAKEGNFYLNIISKGKDVIPNIIDQDVDLILLSNTIENFTAMNLATSVRNLSKEYKKTPIIVLSTEAFKDNIKRFKQAGANDVVTKPFDKNNLLEKIDTILKSV